jgi:transposase
MPAAYSSDLRQRVLNACEAKGSTNAELARTFGISEATLYAWRRAEREEGRREAKPHGGGPQRKLSEADEVVVRQIVEEQNDLTLGEHLKILAERTGKQISDSTMSVVLRRLKLSRKKNAARQ